ncbi:MAG: hypothetical protein IJL71_02595 [Oscillospiraceae bacterium]|nr:hypothetical protein [Oscillospiraceae bacterium]
MLRRAAPNFSSLDTVSVSPSRETVRFTDRSFGFPAPRRPPPCSDGSLSTSSNASAGSFSPISSAGVSGGFFPAQAARARRDETARIIPIILYNGKRGNGGKISKWFFYAYYPIHLLVLGLIKYFIK